MQVNDSSDLVVNVQYFLTAGVAPRAPSVSGDRRFDVFGTLQV